MSRRVTCRLCRQTFDSWAGFDAHVCGIVRPGTPADLMPQTRSPRPPAPAWRRQLERWGRWDKAAGGFQLGPGFRR